VTSLRILLTVGIVLLTATPAQAGRHSIAGQIVDRNSEPVERAVISLNPGNVQMVSDREGRFLIDYLRDEDGERVRLHKRTNYILEVFKPGYHISSMSLEYIRGAVLLQSITVTEETIDVEDHGENLDPGLFTDSSHNSGANYEGE
jgi:hypothetical protein